MGGQMITPRLTQWPPFSAAVVDTANELYLPCDGLADYASSTSNVLPTAAEAK
jgi:hypothetical protein